ncbi:TIGR03745 family integrating conjugative element membrane protein [Pseudomonas aeruginosa]|uniref:TIGR03745 family integrating conjugative element membrane protein n=1 Tax=Pseudomonas aeruginosa TaxID=287 RepID=UPI000BB87EED|nr:TIGR03745 family integrating conjugative element membrane protein [Pseudomonas aeruginosa]PBZ05562.1 TIGR03745 family integrating conjugative element membrane protein [Pseudomonas aeruginosa]TEC50633.1 TIGR03745 family integrating conjugative element membrane protein [Pseudomonas aeruginosa]TEC73137.1 TIGR03745 family integrating conjugative element membrane protein [Pseudomonas aeruginosa]TED19045.1 TIGR03745 family integrating conjugative element membrane protein [Pseudomonas aeruginosa]
MLKFTIQKLSSLCRSLAAITLALPGIALAALPKPEAPTRGEGAGIMQTIQNFGYDGAMFLAALICVAVFLGVAWHTYGTYHAIHDGKKKWSDLGAGVAVGVGLLILIIYLVTKASTIM